MSNQNAFQGFLKIVCFLNISLFKSTQHRLKCSLLTALRGSSIAHKHLGVINMLTKGREMQPNLSNLIKHHYSMDLPTGNVEHLLHQTKCISHPNWLIKLNQDFFSLDKRLCKNDFCNFITSRHNIERHHSNFFHRISVVHLKNKTHVNNLY